jgi:hypothetical protein
MAPIVLSAFGQDRGGSMPIFRLYREALVASGGCANLLPAEFCRSGRQHVAAIS